MSRIHFDTVNGGKLLMRTLAGYLSHTIESFPVDPTTIYEMVVVGNSTMRDLFFRQSVYSIGQPSEVLKFISVVGQHSANHLSSSNLGRYFQSKY